MHVLHPANGVASPVRDVQSAVVGEGQDGGSGHDYRSFTSVVMEVDKRVRLQGVVNGWGKHISEKGIWK